MTLLREETIGFNAKAPVAIWNRKLGADYPGVFKALLKATLAVATANAPGAVAAAIDGFFAFTLQLPPAELAWLLIRRALARAMAELTVESVQGRGVELQDKDGLVTALDQGLEAAEIWIAPGFFDRPDELLIDRVRSPFQEWLLSLKLRGAEANSVQHRLGPYFTFALQREWAEHTDTYAPVEAELRKLETPFAKSLARERSWLRNAAYLQRMIHEPVFEEAFGLAQVYVPLRAWFKETNREKARRAHGRDAEEDHHERLIVVDLERHLDAWLSKVDNKDSIRIICGGPGSGKTSFAKIWAAKLASNGHHVLYVPLHRLDIRTEVPDMQAALWEFLSDLNVLPHDPLDHEKGERRLLILFDGLDELAMQGRAGQEAANNFIQAVENKVSRINERRDRCVQVLLGGRDIVVEAARVAEHKVLHVLPYHSANLRPFEDNEELLTNDKYSCNRWWRQLGEATGEAYTSVPEPLNMLDLADITAQPLLNYLLALSFRRDKIDLKTRPKLNLIYQDLLDAVYERRWGPADHPTKRLLSNEQFNRLMDELGLAAWHGSGRAVAELQIEAACERAGLREQLERFKEGARAGAISLLAAFYFRQAGKMPGGERTFEFTHKSFGEYLTARRIVRSMENIYEDRALNRRSRQRGKTEEEALATWIKITGPTQLDSNVLVFMRSEVSLREREVIVEWRKIFAELFSDQLLHGLPMHQLGLSSYQEMVLQARNAEQALLAAHFCCASACLETSPIPWPTHWALRDLLARLAQGSDYYLSRNCLGWLGSERPGHDLRWANLETANLEGASLNEAQLSVTNLTHANFALTDLERATLRQANLRQANLHLANLEGANLEGASLEGANLAGAYLAGANLEGAKLTGVVGHPLAVHRADRNQGQLSRRPGKGTRAT